MEDKQYYKEVFYEELSKEAFSELEEFFNVWKEKWQNKNLDIIYIYNIAFLDPDNFDCYHFDWRSNINSISQFNAMHEHVVKEIAVHENSAESAEDD